MAACSARDRKGVYAQNFKMAAQNGARNNEIDPFITPKPENRKAPNFGTAPRYDRKLIQQKIKVGCIFTPDR